MSRQSIIFSQAIPLAFALALFLLLTEIVFAQVHFLNSFSALKIIESIRPLDVLIGMTIYFKTSVDFAIFIGNFMAVHRGWRSRVAIETGTSLGNALGTILILTVWDFFREVSWILAAVILLASLVLLRLAQDSFDDALNSEDSLGSFIKNLGSRLSNLLSKFNRLTDPFLSRVVPHISVSRAQARNFWPLLGVSFTVPFILGLDGFAGYVPLFNVINVLGFAVGTFSAHLILNAFLFLSPDKTITFVKNPIISYLGALAFIGLALFGFYEAFQTFF